MNKIVIGIVIVLIALVGIVYFVGMNDEDDIMESDVTVDDAVNEQNDNNQEEVETNPDTATEVAEVQSSVALTPTETGRSVVVSTATISAPGYVVIYRVNSNNESSQIGHSSLLSAGTHSNVSIPLDSIVARQQTVVAVLHEDDGDGEFEVPGSDGYLGNSDQSIVSFVDVVDISADDESEVLKANVEAYLEENLAS